MSDPYVSAQDVNVNHNGFPHGSDVSFGQAPTVPIIRKKLMGYVGFANLPNQVHRKSVRKGFQFTAMVVGPCFFPLFRGSYVLATNHFRALPRVLGESGLGKSTLINTLFSTTLYPPKVPLAPAEERPKTVAIESIGAGTSIFIHPVHGHVSSIYV